MVEYLTSIRYQMIDRNSFFEIIHKELGTEDREQIEQAYFLAKVSHRNQTRDSGERYFEHPKKVVLILIEFSPTTSREVILGLLHDTEEDQFIPRGMIRKLFGERMYEGLKLLSKYRIRYETHARIEKIKISNHVYYARLEQADMEVRRVKLADRLHNLKTLSGCAPEKIKRKIIETREHILPLAEITDESFFKAIHVECEKLESLPSGA